MHNDLSLANIIVDPTTFKVTGVVDWECIGTVPRWEDVIRNSTMGLMLTRWRRTRIIPGIQRNDLARHGTELWENWKKVKAAETISSDASVFRRPSKTGNLEKLFIWHRRAENWVLCFTFFFNETIVHQPGWITYCNHSIKKQMQNFKKWTEPSRKDGDFFLDREETTQPVCQWHSS